MKTYKFSFFLFFSIVIVSFLDMYPDQSWSLDKATASVLDLTAEEKLFKDKKYTEAIESLTKKTDKLDAKGFRLLGQCYSGLKNVALAMKNYNLAISQNPKDYESKTLLAIEFLKEGKDLEARTAIKEALEINPAYEPAYLATETLYVRRKNNYELRVLYMDMLEKIGPKPEYFARLCELHTQSGIYDLAKQYCRKGIELAKEKEPRNYVYLAIALKDSGEIEEAKILFKKSAEIFPKSEDAQIYYAQFLDEQKNFFESLKYYKAATIASPELVKAWIGMAMSSYEIQKYQDALDHLRHACTLSPSAGPNVRRIMGLLMVQKLDSWYAKFDKLNEECSYLSQKTK